jgi:hypothetical protein
MILGSITPSTCYKPAKNQQAMLAGKATHNQQYEEKILFLGKKFFSLKTYDKK